MFECTNQTTSAALADKARMGATHFLMKSSCDAVSIPQRSNWKQTSAHSSSVIMKTPSPIDGPNPQMKSSHPYKRFCQKTERTLCSEL
jgi:hypothetical protein